MSTRDSIIETRPDISIDELKREASRALVAMQDAERAEQRAVEHFEKTKDEAARRRLELGRILAKARKQWPARGPRAKGWGEFLRDLGIEESTAWRYMQLAGYQDEQKVSCTIGGVQEIATYAEVGITRGTEPKEDEWFGCADCGESFPTPVWHCRGCAHHWDDSRLSCWNCHEFNSDGSCVVVDADDAEEEKEARAISETFPLAQTRIPSMDERARRTHRLVQAITSAKSTLSACLKTENIHLTDVTTSPHEFEQVKGLIIELVNELLAELDRAGVLDGNEKRRQLKLLDGGLSK